MTPVLHVVQRVVARHLLAGARLEADEGHGGAVTLIQRFGTAANLNIHLHCLMLDGVYRCVRGAERIQVCYTSRHVLVRRGWGPLLAEGCVAGREDEVVPLD